MSPDTITFKTTMRLDTSPGGCGPQIVSALAELQRLDARIECARSVQNRVQLKTPSEADLAKLLITSKLQSAEVVELADTPS